MRPYERSIPKGLRGRGTLQRRTRVRGEVANIVGHGARNGREPDVRVTLETRPDSIVLIFSDDGVPIDPRGRPDPVMPKSLAEAMIGGFGLMLVRHAASSLDNVRTADDRSRLTVSVSRR